MIKFCIIALDSGWNLAALTDALLNGLSENLKNRLASHDVLADLEAVIHLAKKIDRRLAR